ncbi:MAG: phosphodiester glycosidase family protein [Deltaproteobacteria bacterium]|nr:phosphodiester glycosidase family protein [Deltaproteobacteria bacterium]
MPTPLNAYRAAIAVLWGSLIAPNLAHAQDQWADISPGIRVLHRVTRHADRSPLRVHVVVLDPCLAQLSVRATTPTESGMLTSRWARRVHARVAINGDFFDRPTRPLGPSRGLGQDFAPRESYYFGAIVFSSPGNLLTISQSGAPPTARDFLATQERIVYQGQARIDRHVRHSQQRHPRSAIGFSRDGRTLALVVVDGRSARSVGATTPELALILRDLGAWEAVRLDGGGSSTLVVDGRVINQPSDGGERAVANHIGWLEQSGPGEDICQRDHTISDGAPQTDASFPASARPARMTAVLPMHEPTIRPVASTARNGSLSTPIQ